MACSTQTGQQTYFVVVFSRDGRETLLAANSNRLALPRVEIPPCQRVAENVTAAVQADWGEEVVCLFELNDLPGAPNSGMHYQVAEHRRAVGVPRVPTTWIPIASLSNNSLIGIEDCFAVERAKTQCANEKTSSARPFTSLGWFKELGEWVEGVVEPLGFHLSGSFRQLNASPTFSLIRFETDGPAIWFKAVGEPNQREFPITCVLSRLLPDCVPHVVATRPDWKGWLMREAVGRLLSDVQEDAVWEKSGSSLAELQIDSIDHGAEILAAGAHDLCISELSKKVGPFIETMTKLMERQIKITPAPLSHKELLLLGDRLQTALDALEALGIPETLGHLDLNPGNIIVSAERCVFLDWAEAYIGNPFFTFQYLLEHMRRTVGGDSALEMSLVSSYRESWERIVGTAGIDDGLSITRLLAVFAYAAGTEVWRDEERMQYPAIAGFLRSLVRRMYREAKIFRGWGSLCLD